MNTGLNLEFITEVVKGEKILAEFIKLLVIL